MILRKLTLKNFRNYQQAQVNAHPRLNLFFGLNAQGKTNLLEAIFMLGVGKSFRTPHDQEMIKQGETSFFLKGETEGEREIKLEIGYVENQKKQFKINGEVFRRTSDFFGNLPLVLFNPDDLQIIKAGPVMRRRLLDIHFSQISARYKQESIKYEAVLRQRNHLLREGLSRKTDEELLEIYTQQLVQAGAYLMWYRIQKIPRLQSLAGEVQKKITSDRELLVLDYIAGENRAKPASLEECGLFLAEEGKKIRNEEKRKGLTLFGPHRHELKVSLEGQGDLRTFGSQGQQRAAILSLKMAVLSLLHEETGIKPLLLLDDVLSEFDDIRQKLFLQESLKNVQTFLTYASKEKPELTGQEWQGFRIENGAVREEN